MLQITDYIIKKGNEISSFEAFNKYILEKTEVRSRLNELLKNHAGINFNELLQLTEFQYIRSLYQNEKALINGDGFEAVSMLYSLSDGKVTNIDEMEQEEYKSILKATTKPLIVSCDPYNYFTQFYTRSKQGSGGWASVNDHLADGISLTITENFENEALVEGYMLDTSNLKSPEIITHKEVIQVYEREKE